MKDRFIAGAIAGSVGAIVQFIIGLATKALGLTDRTFSDFAKIFMMFQNYPGFLAMIVGFFVEIIIGGIAGVLFAYLIKYTLNKYFYIKALMIGAFLWMFFGFSGTAFRLPLFMEIPPKPAFTTFVVALIFGLITGLAFKFLYKKAEN